MLIVTDVKIAEVPDNHPFIHRAYEYPNATIHLPSALDNTTTVKVTTEEINGKPFQLYNRTYVIGWSKQVQNAIGIPLEAMENLTQKIMRLTKENHQLREQLRNN